MFSHCESAAPKVLFSSQMRYACVPVAESGAVSLPIGFPRNERFLRWRSDKRNVENRGTGS